ncbi:MAG: hypothetical protein IIC09_06640, partial [Proteobacteria bacterium]|nr:hypothetical protein [Pseudomonadota bacterium]
MIKQVQIEQAAWQIMSNAAIDIPEDYRRGIEEVRIKRMSDIEVAAHELAHLL